MAMMMCKHGIQTNLHKVRIHGLDVLAIVYYYVYGVWADSFVILWTVEIVGLFLLVNLYVFFTDQGNEETTTKTMIFGIATRIDLLDYIMQHGVQLVNGNSNSSNSEESSSHEWWIIIIRRTTF